ncbi:MAG TPA: MBL fold metallo-hydrolase [Vicinamibacterales bacterium]
MTLFRGSVCAGAIVAALSVTTTMTAQQTAVPDPIVKANATVKLARHTYAIPDGNVPLVPNVGIIVGSHATLVIDPGLGRPNGETVLREAKKLSASNELFITSTHFHAEHTTGAGAFPLNAAYVWSSIQAAEFDDSGAQLIQTFARRSPKTAQLLAGADRPTKGDGGNRREVLFDREYVLDLGGVRVRFLVVGPTHTRGDTALFVEGDTVLFAGDVVMNNSFLAATTATSMKAWLKAFDTLEALHPTTIVPSHGAIGTGALIDANRKVMEAVQARTRELKLQGRSAEESASAVQKELQAQHPDWPRAGGLSAAALSAYAETP